MPNDDRIPNHIQYQRGNSDYKLLQIFMTFKAHSLQSLDMLQMN